MAKLDDDIIETLDIFMRSTGHSKSWEILKGRLLNKNDVTNLSKEVQENKEHIISNKENINTNKENIDTIKEQLKDMDNVSEADLEDITNLF